MWQTGNGLVPVSEAFHMSGDVTRRDRVLSTARYPGFFSNHPPRLPSRAQVLFQRRDLSTEQPEGLCPWPGTGGSDEGPWGMPMADGPSRHLRAEKVHRAGTGGSRLLKQD